MNKLFNLVDLLATRDDISWIGSIRKYWRWGRFRFCYGRRVYDYNGLCLGIKWEDN